ncbi:hypothetical protein DKE45_012375 [Acinetobacter pittii]|nr:hypothetical protein DKE45_012375 [Acinetobacter pittii]
MVNGLKFKFNNELMVVVGDLRACIFPKMRVFFMPIKKVKIVISLNKKYLIYSYLKIFNEPTI